MKRLCQISMLLAAMLAGVCHAQETSACKSTCASEKAQCRAKAEAATVDDVTPLIQKEPVPSERFSADSSRLGAGAGARVLDKRELNSRRMERLNACEARHLRCTRTCSAPPAAAPAPAAG